MKTNFFILFLFLSTFSALADEWADLNKAFKKMYSLECFSFSVQVKLYKKTEDVKPDIYFDGEARKKGKNFYSKLMGKSVVYNDHTKDLIHINQDEKTIIYSKNLSKDSTRKISFTQKQALQLDSTVLANCSAHYISKDASLICIEFINKKPSKYKTIRIEMDARTFIIKRVTYFPKEIKGQTYYAKIDITYNNFSIDKSISDDYFDSGKYVTAKGNKVKLKPTYKNYKLVNQLETL